MRRFARIVDALLVLPLKRPLHFIPDNPMKTWRLFV